VPLTPHRHAAKNSGVPGQATEILVAVSYAIGVVNLRPIFCRNYGNLKTGLSDGQMPQN